MEKPIISIILPMYNAEQYIKKAIESILAQTYSNLDIILINDGSKDRTLSIVREYNKYPFVRIVDKINSGQSDCRAIGYEMSVGEYVYFMDADDSLENNAIETMYNKMIKDYSDFCCCRYRLVNTEGKIIKDSAKYKYDIIEQNVNILKDALLTKEIKSTLWMKLFKKSFLKENNIIPVSTITLHDDCMFTLLCSVYAKKVSFVNDILYNVLINDRSISRTCKPLMITIYDDIFTIIKQKLLELGKYQLVEKEYYQGYAKCILFALILAAIRSPSYADYLNIYKSISEHSIFFSKVYQHTIKSDFKLNFLNIISKYSSIFYYSMRVFKSKIKH